jgi:hypothetical protein
MVPALTGSLPGPSLALVSCNAMLDISGLHHDNRPAPATVTLHDVRVVAATSEALIVQTGRHRVAVPRSSVQPGSTAREDVPGTLVLSITTAGALGLH